LGNKAYLCGKIVSCLPNRFRQPTRHDMTRIPDAAVPADWRSPADELAGRISEIDAERPAAVMFSLLR
jgi:hypothetical protein